MAKSSSSTKLTITAYPKFSNGMLEGSAVDAFSLQVNPEQLSISYDLSGKEEADEEPTAANGVPVSDKNKAYNRQSVSLEFYIDNTGIFPNQPMKGKGAKVNQQIAIGTSIKEAVEKLHRATIKPVKSTHKPPYVHLQWGTAVSLKGKVNDLGITYLRFNMSGDPIRAKVSLTVREEIDGMVVSRENQSPDITRIPTIKEGDTLVSLCHEFYDDPSYFIKVAEFNNLPTFRRLQVGSMLQFPPIEK